MLDLLQARRIILADEVSRSVIGVGVRKIGPRDVSRHPTRLGAA